MIALYGSEGVMAHITLMPDEKLPMKWNIPQTIVYRWSLKDKDATVIKAFGNVWPIDDERLDAPFKPDITMPNDPWKGLSVDEE